MPHPHPLPCVALLSVGCRTNQEELSSLHAGFVSQGYEVVEDVSRAEVIVVNTCTVTGATEGKVRRMIKGLARNHPHARIFLTGCLAQQKPEELIGMPGVSRVVGNAEKLSIPFLVKETGEGIVHRPLSRNSSETLRLPEHLVSAKQATRTRASIKIQEGCDFRCAYCIVPSVRGPSRSLPLPAILDHTRRLLDLGYKELVLTGTHVGQYRGEKNQRLTDCLEQVTSLNGDFRVRLSSLDPRDIEPRLIQHLTANPRVCRHVHLSVQSLDNSVLRRMNRHEILAEEIVERCRALRQSCPEIAIGFDIIVGFPGETLEMFLTTLHNMDTIGPSYAHVFRYSPRPGTPAAEMTGQLSEQDKTTRSQKARETVNGSRTRFIQGLRNVSLRLLTESEFPLSGLTSNYLRVVVPQTGGKHNEWADVYVEGVETGTSRVIGRCV